MKRPEQVERHRMVPHRHIDLGNRCILDDRSACAIVKYIQLAETADCLLDRAPDAILFGDVGFDESRFAARVANHGFAGASQLRLQFGDRDARAFQGEQARRRSRDSRSRSCDKRDLSLETSHDCASFSRMIRSAAAAPELNGAALRSSRKNLYLALFV
jgi:hypothetical protein